LYNVCRIKALPSSPRGVLEITVDVLQDIAVVQPVIGWHGNVFEPGICLFQPHDRIALIMEENLSSQFPSFSIIVPITMTSAPALDISLAVCASRMPPPTIKVPLYSLLTVETISGGTLREAPVPASREANLMPMYCADRAYIA